MEKNKSRSPTRFAPSRRTIADRWYEDWSAIDQYLVEKLSQWSQRAPVEPVLLQMRHVDDVNILNRDFQTQISYHQEVLQFADPDAPLTKFDKILLGAMLTFLYSAFAVAVALTIHYNG